MSVQSEAQLEHELIQHSKQLGYQEVEVKDELQLLSNLKIQVERANDISAFSNEWAQVLNHLKAGNSFNCAKVLRNRFPVTLMMAQHATLIFCLLTLQKHLSSHQSDRHRS
jgi:type I restriction enzyme R subunit